VRLRLWNDPSWTNYSTEADVTRSSERAMRAGMKVLLDFHYSDDWADPQKQTIPAAWAATSATRTNSRPTSTSTRVTCWQG
jgi:arabinogalactan endo-1,4-beta-galactosidase